MAEPRSADRKAADSLPAEKAVSGPPEDKSLKRSTPCPKCGEPLAKYSGSQAHKAGRNECAKCGYHS
jgi:hypothetical protein